ncbi:MAG: gliding motility-associated C-terminal domain-containing protein [Saprospiraceae bacterium]|nr:gliding motility-associated C-terminal domain-containing protein [Saprospiraceae bacterium]
MLNRIVFTLSRNLAICIFVLGYLSNSCSQIQSSIWYFGRQAGLDFSTEPPTPLYNPNLANHESNATLTDSSGNLLFYVTANRIYNKNHVIMDNGDGLVCNGGSSAQGPMIVQDPSDAMRYYVFMTADETSDQYRGNLRYTIVDLCENGGLGKVVPGLKNILIPGKFSERLTSVSLNQGKAFWILTSKLFENTIICFYLDELGIHTSNPVISYFGQEFSPQVGQMKVNNKKTQILYSAGLNASGNGVWLMDFDTLSGKLSNRFIINEGTHDYGIEFSPSDRLVYYTSFYVVSGVYQFDLSSRVKRTLFQYPAHYYVASINRDPHGRLIVSSGIKSLVSAILNPDVPGLQCNYTESYVQLLPNTYGHFGLQNTVLFIRGHTNPIDENFLGKDTFLCNPAGITLYAPNSQTLWSTGHIGSSLTVFQPGTYWAKLEYQCETILDSIHIELFKKPELILENSIKICEGNNDTIHASQNSTWSDGHFGKQLIVNSSGIFWAKISTPCGELFDTVVVELVSRVEPPQVLRDTSFCENVPFRFSINIPQVKWNTGELETIVLDSPGVYTYHFDNGCQQFSDEMQINIEYKPNPLPEMITECEGQIVTLLSGDPKSVWSTGETGSEIMIRKNGIYSYTLINACGIFSHSTEVEFLKDFTKGSFPNVFSPNGDQINDEFPGREFNPDFYIKIFNRWGELLFEGKNQSWDGFFKSRPMPPATYVFVAEWEACGQKRKVKGSVTLVK